MPNGDTIALRAANGLYLSRINRGDRNPIEAAKRNIDGFSMFKMTIVGNYEVTLQADNGMYLSMINDGDTNTIEAAKSSVDAFCKFRVYEFAGATVAGGAVALIADNDKYLTPVNRDDAYPVEAFNSGPNDPGSIFTLERLYEK